MKRFLLIMSAVALMSIWTVGFFVMGFRAGVNVDPEALAKNVADLVAEQIIDALSNKIGR